MDHEKVDNTPEEERLDGIMVLPNLEVDPEEVNKHLRALMNISSPAERKIIQEILDRREGS